MVQCITDVQEVNQCLTHIVNALLAWLDTYVHIHGDILHHPVTGAVSCNVLDSLCKVQMKKDQKCTLTAFNVYFETTFHVKCTDQFETASFNFLFQP